MNNIELLIIFLSLSALLAGLVSYSSVLDERGELVDSYRERYFSLCPEILETPRLSFGEFVAAHESELNFSSYDWYLVYSCVPVR